MFNVKQNPNNPLVYPIKNNNWESVAACNGCPIVHKGSTYVVYRAIATPDKVKAEKLYQSTIGIVKVEDECSLIERQQLITPEKDWEEYGCEDPRVTKLDKKYFIFYTALSSQNLGPESIKVAVAISDDLKEIKEKHLITPFNAKAMSLFPEKINGMYTAVLTVNTDNPPAEIAIYQCKEIEDLWNKDKWTKWYKNLDKNKIVLRRKDGDLTEVGAPPIKTKYGWLLIYSHIQNYFSGDKRIFGIEAVLLDLNDPKKIIGKTEFPFMIPDQIYSKYGFVSDVSFPTGAVIKGEDLEIYYGASDTTTCTATLKLNSLLRVLRNDSQKELFVRYKQNPILKPVKEDEWQNKNVFNPGAIDLAGKVRIFYRAQSDKNTSTIGYAESVDGQKITYQHPEPCYVPRTNDELKKGGETCNSGCEDPRLTLIGNNVYMLYTAYNGVDWPRIAISSLSKKDLIAKKFENWSEPIIISPRGHDDKDACILPKKFSKKGYFVIHRISSHITGDYVNNLNFTPNEIDTSMGILEPRSGMWDSLKVGLASTPHLLSEGWLMFYHGVSSDGAYRLGVALLNKNNPTEVLGRSAFPIFEPKELYEKEGEIPNVVFPCGSVIRGDKVYIYYGGADRCVGVATAKLKDLLKSLE